MRIVTLTEKEKNNILENMLKRSPNQYGKYQDAVDEILNAVKDRKDKALFEYTEKFDGVTITPETIRVTKEEIDEAYEKNTGLVIIETFETRGIKPMYTPAVLCSNHGPFTWGKDAAEAVHNAVVLEEVAKMARNTELINPKVKPAPDCIKEKHFYRKHGANAYYGQN